MEDLTTYYPDYFGHISRAQNLMAELLQDGYKRPAIVLRAISDCLQSPAGADLFNPKEDFRELQEIRGDLERGFEEIVKQLSLAQDSLRSYPAIAKTLPPKPPKKPR
jgi:hypothetical protein